MRTIQPTQKRVPSLGMTRSTHLCRHRVADDLSCVPMPAADPIAEEDLMDEKLKDLLDEWMSAIPRDDKMMLCLVLFQLCRKEFKLGAIDADKTTRF